MTDVEKPNRQLTIVVGIIERDATFLITRRVDRVAMWHHAWEFPGGKINRGEDPSEALRREIREETGLTIAHTELIGVHTHHWRLPDHVQQTFLLVFRCRTKSGNVRLLQEENDQYRWVTLKEFYQLDNVLGSNFDMVRQLYEPLVRTS